MMSRRSSTASEKKRGKSMTRSKSPFRSFRFKKKSAPDTESEHGLEDDDNMRAIGKIIGNLGDGDGDGHGISDIIYYIYWLLILF